VVEACSGTGIGTEHAHGPVFCDQSRLVQQTTENGDERSEWVNECTKHKAWAWSRRTSLVFGVCEHRSRVQNARRTSCERKCMRPSTLICAGNLVEGTPATGTISRAWTSRPASKPSPAFVQRGDSIVGSSRTSSAVHASATQYKHHLPRMGRRTCIQRFARGCTAHTYPPSKHPIARSSCVVYTANATSYPCPSRCRFRFHQARRNGRCR
jgi:hypothetical protein